MYVANNSTCSKPRSGLALTHAEQTDDLRGIVKCDVRCLSFYSQSNTPLVLVNDSSFREIEM